MFSDDSSDQDGPRHYSQVAAAAIHQELNEANGRIRQLENLIGILNREADHQVEEIAQLREEIARWQMLYARACAPADPEKE